MKDGLEAPNLEDPLAAGFLSNTSTWYNRMLKSTLSSIIKVSNHVPQHIGFIMDGNRRYAKQHKLKVKQGHDLGFFSMCSVLELCYECGVKSATVFAFSIENFKRSQSEVDALMELARKRILQIVQHGELCAKYGVKVRILGDRSLLDDDVLEELQKAEKITESNSRATLNICFPYTGRYDLYQSMHAIVQASGEGFLDYKNITAKTIDDYLYTRDDPPVDLLIRTSGVKRLSDFLVWQVQQRGVVLEFLDCLWPEFSVSDMWFILLKFTYNKTVNGEGSLPSNTQDTKPTLSQQSS
ncbi:hypothetical protein ACO0RG_001476 [Hanseniaspora osmophila]|uniref:Alkyl transferase n=1 Tax=Hanseniaspora osmophila TaxID=56408 RepID=A0A1E5R1W5_9ASCO|nr:Dehydrodolichyl diphosphate synthase complex subunit RER2 [Hanseniaspora osmophila]